MKSEGPPGEHVSAAIGSLTLFSNGGLGFPDFSQEVGELLGWQLLVVLVGT